MKTFSLRLQDAENSYECNAVESCVVADSSGQFGLLAGAEPVIAALRFGLARFKPANEPWHYVALPSGVLQFDGSTAVITTTHFLVDTDRNAMSEALDKEIAASEHAVSSTRQMITNIEHTLMKKLWEMGRQA